MRLQPSLSNLSFNADVARVSTGFTRFLDEQNLGPLRRVWMIRTGVNFQLPELAPAKDIPGQHAADRILDDALGMRGTDFPHRSSPQSPGVTGVARVKLLGFFLSCQHDLLGVDDYDEVTHIRVRCERWFCLAAKGRCDDGRNSTQCLAICVDHVPPFTSIQICHLRRPRSPFHNYAPSSPP